MKKLLAAGILATSLAACTFTYRTPVEGLRATVTRSTLLETIPSGSALELRGDSLYIVSDDAPYIYVCRRNGAALDSLRLRQLPADRHRVPKDIKADYEAAIIADVNGRSCIIAFGSGTLQPYRGTAVIQDLHDTAWQKVVPMEPLYAAMRRQAGISADDFNIEAAALAGERLLLFSRGTNHMFLMDWPAIVDYLMAGGKLPEIHPVVVAMPKKGRFPAGISGAAMLDERHLLISSSVEATTSWKADGEVLGSYVSVLEIDPAGKPMLLGIAPLINEQQDTLKTKLEGVFPAEALNREQSRMSVIGIVDNDDGTSRLLDIRLINVKLP
jgi:hypothetical protein